MGRAKKQSAKSPMTGFKSRVMVIACLLGIYAAGLTARLVYLQVFQHETLLAEAEKQNAMLVKVNTGRGRILDRNLNPLATNVDVESVGIAPRQVEDPARTLRILATHLNMDRQELLMKMEEKKKFVWIKRKVAMKEVAQLKKLGLPGVEFRRESQRFYPKSGLAANTLGIVGLDNQGLEGIEHKYDNLLKGTTRKKFTEKDNRGRPLLNVEEGVFSASPSHDLQLTLDEVIQFHTETALARQVKRYRAKGGVAIVMEPKTGDVLAMASYPTFNPNQYNSVHRNVRRNKAVQDAYDPGSIFKPIVAAASLEEKTAKPNSIFFCNNGRIRIGKTTVREASNHKFGWLSLKQIIVKSSNIGSIHIAKTLGEKRFYDYIRRFGFGSRLGIGLPGESSGLLSPLKKWTSRSLPSISFGHEITVTPVQITTAMAAIANGGELMKPRIAKAVLKNEKKVKIFKPKVLRRVISEKTSRQMVGILKAVVTDGTGKKAKVDGFDVAGKTGTAQKYDPNTGRYSSDSYMASFIGFVPADAPRLVILVMIDDPKDKDWGGEVAAPAFSEIAKKTLQYLNVPSGDERVFVLDRA